MDYCYTLMNSGWQIFVRFFLKSESCHYFLLFLSNNFHEFFLLLIVGGLAGALHAAVFEPPAAMNGFAYALRHMGMAGALTGI